MTSLDSWKRTTDLGLALAEQNQMAEAMICYRAPWI